MAIAVISVCLLSETLEFLQLLYKLGFAEFDDVFDNRMGVAIGYSSCVDFYKICGRDRDV